MGSDPDSMGEVRPLPLCLWRTGSLAPSSAIGSTSGPTITSSNPAPHPRASPQSQTEKLALQDYERAALAVQELDALLSQLTTSTPTSIKLASSAPGPRALRTLNSPLRPPPDECARAGIREIRRVGVSENGAAPLATNSMKIARADAHTPPRVRRTDRKDAE